MCWSSYWPEPWMFFGPIMFLLMVAGIAGMILMARRETMRRSGAETGAGDGLGPAGRNVNTRQCKDRPTGFELYREEMTRRLDQEHREFQESMGYLRMAKARAEFDLSMAERRTQLS